MSRAWPSEAAQADYETLRTAVLAGTPLTGPAARRFAACGLAGLIRAPVAAPQFAVTVVGATRPAWCGSHDPRLQALAAGYGLVLTAGIVHADDERQEVYG